MKITNIKTAATSGHGMHLWVKIETFGFPLALFAFLWWQIIALQKHMIDPDKKA